LPVLSEFLSDISPSKTSIGSTTPKDTQAHNIAKHGVFDRMTQRNDCTKPWK